MDKYEEFEKMALDMGGEVITLTPSENLHLNILDIDKPEITDEYLNKKELEVRELFDMIDTMNGITSKEFAIEKLHDLSFLKGQPEEWKTRAVKILNEYANK